MHAAATTDTHTAVTAGTGDSPGDVCPQCESEWLVARHCKRVCPRCGYVESCEDLFPDTRDRRPS